MAAAKLGAGQAGVDGGRACALVQVQVEGCGSSVEGRLAQRGSEESVADPERLAPCERCAELQARVNKLSEKLARAGVV